MGILWDILPWLEKQRYWLRNVYYWILLQISVFLLKHRMFNRCRFYFSYNQSCKCFKCFCCWGKLIWKPNQSTFGCSYIPSCHRRSCYTSRVVEEFFQKLDKLYANTFISCSMFMMKCTDLQYIVVTEIDLATTWRNVCFYMNCSHFSEWFLNVTAFSFPKSFNQFCILLIYNQCICAPFFICHDS